MHFKVLLILGASWLVSAIDAPITTGNDPKVAFRATLPDRSTTKIRGLISGHSENHGGGIVFKVKFTGLPKEDGPFHYHIHENPLSADGNCSSAAAHLDPYARGEAPICDSGNPQTCQVGDLSGKHGDLVSGKYEAKYTDPYLSTVAGAQAFFGNRSIVIHNKDKKRLTCANFTLIVHETNSSATTHRPTSTVAPVAVSTAFANATGSHTPTTGIATVPTGGASAQGLSAAVLLLGGFALLL